MNPLERPRRRKRERRGMRGGLENRARLETILEPREPSSSKKPLLRSETGENDTRGSRLRPFVGPGRAYGTPDFDPSEPVPYVLTWHGLELVKRERIRAAAARSDDDELAQEEELEELGLEELEEEELDADDYDDDGNPIYDDDDDDDDEWDDDAEVLEAGPRPW